ncbi:LmrA/YxaF family transcription factor, partial [Streptomyces sp. NPDC002078]
VGRMPDLQAACAVAFANWRRLVEDKLLANGLSEDDARDLALTVISTLEGAEMAAQVSESQTPLLVAGRHLARLISAYA